MVNYLMIKGQKNLVCPYLEVQKRMVRLMQQTKKGYERVSYESYQFSEVFSDLQWMKERLRETEKLEHARLTYLIHGCSCKGVD